MQIVSQASPSSISQAELAAAATQGVTLDLARAQEIMDMLCNFYSDMSIEGLRKLGFELKVNHYRYQAQAMPRIRKMSTHKATDFLQPMHVLRDLFELQMDTDKTKPVHTNYVSSSGGRVIVALLEPGNPEELVATVTCSALDPYNKKKGVLMALARLFNLLCERHGIDKRDVVQAVKKFEFNPTKPVYENLVAEHV